MIYDLFQQLLQLLQKESELKKSVCSDKLSEMQMLAVTSEIRQVNQSLDEIIEKIRKYKESK